MGKRLLQEIESGTRRAIMKKNIINFFMQNNSATITDIARELSLSVPTVTKFIDEMCAENYVRQNGKLETSGGRHPSLYELNASSSYFVGVEVNRFGVNMGLMDFKGDIVKLDMDVPLLIKNTPESLDDLCDATKNFIRETKIDEDKILNINVDLAGHVNPFTGFSYSMFFFDNQPVADKMSRKVGIHVTIDNDARAMTYGEFTKGVVKNEKDIIFINVNWGLGMGLIIDGKLYYGKSGFAGEFGHVCAYENDILCHCGKRGCIETEVSGSALFRKLKERLNNGDNSQLLKYHKSIDELTLNDFIDAIQKEDVFCIELVEEMGEKLGRQVAGLINIFNPELVIIGGLLSVTGDYLIQPVSTAIRKYSLNLMNRDTVVVESKLKEKAGIIGACMTARRRVFED